MPPSAVQGCCSGSPEGGRTRTGCAGSSLQRQLRSQARGNPVRPAWVPSVEQPCTPARAAQNSATRGDASPILVQFFVPSRIDLPSPAGSLTPTWLLPSLPSFLTPGLLCIGPACPTCAVNFSPLVSQDKGNAESGKQRGSVLGEWVWALLTC